MKTDRPETGSYCAYCGHPVPDAGGPERFGERFCSEAHAEEFATGVRATRMREVARRETGAASACAVPPAGERTWNAYLKRGLCWGAPLLLLVAIPLIWSGGWAATGGSLLSVLALVACPLGMYFMMRTMMPAHRDGDPHAGQPGSTPRDAGKEDGRA